MENVTIKSLPRVTVASYRVTIASYDELFKVAPETGKKMEKQGAQCRDPFYCFNIYHDEEYRERDIDIDVCEAVVEPLPNGEGIVYKTVDGVKTAACIFHRGDYAGLSTSYAKILEWIEMSEYKVDGLFRESFIDGIWNRENPDEWLTEIQIPVCR